jgi:hypothetical protein
VKSGLSSKEEEKRVFKKMALRIYMDSTAKE